MIRPARFYPNPETALDNAFQQVADTEANDTLTLRAQNEFDHATKALRDAGIIVHIFDDTANPAKPDAVFPNNWFTTHKDGRVVLYPMFSLSRRLERRVEIIEALKENYQVTQVVDYSPYEQRGLYLEGTGSLVLDRVHRLAYVSLSKRADREPLETFCSDFNYEPVVFESTGNDGRPVYHTNVMFCLASEFALVGLELINDSTQREMIRERLQSTGKIVIPLDRHQIENFAGNALELHNEQSRLLVLSTRAAAALNADQRATIEQSTHLLPLSLPTIELAGGSARCMMATIHLPPLTSY